MTTATRRIIRETDHVRNAERFLGGRLEETLKPYLNETGTMSDLANAVGVQKATVNYWIMRLGIKYARVAYDETEEVRIYSREEAEAADAAIESGLDADQLAGMDRPTYDAFREFQQYDHSASEYRDFSDWELRLLETIRQVGDRIQDVKDDVDFPECLKAAVEMTDRGIASADLQNLTRSDVQSISHLKSIGAKKRDVVNLDSDSIDHLRDFEDKGLRLEDFAGFNMRRLSALKRAENAGMSLEQFAALTPEDLDLLDSVRQAGWRKESKMKSDLNLLDTVRQAGWDDEAKMRADLELLDAVRKAGLDSPAKLEAYQTLIGQSPSQPVNGRTS